jgi:phosphoenolpyruvate synthase/pyruvate phosphate dikinase
MSEKLLWKKVVTREFPFIFAAYTIDCYRVMKEKVGATLNYNLFHGEGPILSIYRVEKDIQESYKMIEDMVISDPDRVLKIMGVYGDLTKKVYYLLNEIEKETNKNQIRHKLLEFDQIWLQTICHLLFIVFIGYGAHLKGTESFLKKNMRRFEDLRNNTVDNDVNEKYPKLFSKYKADLENLASFMTPSELRDVLNDKEVNWDKIKARKKRYLIIYSNGDSIEYFGSDIDEVFEKELEHLQIDKDQKSLKGGVAYKGKAVGTARVIFTKKDYENIKEGDIIVTPMTKPSITPYLKKASGIVTNDGGALSHASIISREMKIPCIVGTTYATDIIEDGTKIEVDAEKGIVRKLS